MSIYGCGLTNKYRYGERYWTISPQQGVSKEVWNNSVYDICLYLRGLIFHTKEQAEAAAKVYGWNDSTAALKLKELSKVPKSEFCRPYWTIDVASIDGVIKSNWCDCVADYRLLTLGYVFHEYYDAVEAWCKLELDTGILPSQAEKLIACLKDAEANDEEV